MSARPTTVEALDAFDRCLTRVHHWLSGTVKGSCGYASSAIVDRLSQKIAEVGHAPFAMAAVGDPALIGLRGGIIRSELLKLDVATGRVSVTWTTAARRLAEFAVYWTRCLVAVLAAVSTRRSGSPAVLIIDLPDEAFDGLDDSRFTAFARQGAIDPLRSGRRLLLGKDPLLSLLRTCALPRAERLRLLGRHLRLLPQVIGAVISTPVLALIAPEMAYAAVARALDAASQIEGVVLTCSAWWWQPLWMRNLRRAGVHMLWYSQNPQVIRYRHDDTDSVGPRFRWMHVTTHWVWTRAFAAYIGRHSQGPVDCRVVPPIVWYLPARQAKPAQAIKIVAFDVPALQDDVILRHGGETTNYYSVANLSAFTNDILLAAGDLRSRLRRPVHVHFKMKRGLQPHYDRSYFQFVDRLAAEGKLTIEDTKQNPFALIDSAHIVIAFPFTSPAYVAEYLQVPAIYYDPTGEIVRDDFADSALVSFAAGPGELARACERAVA